MSSPASEPGFDVAALRAALTGLRGTIRENAPLAPLTHVRIGGPAALLIEPLTGADVARGVRACRDHGAPLFVLGGGSNVLVDDAGVRGVVLALGAFQRVVRDGRRVQADAGVTLASLIRNTRDLGLAGLERLVGIPAQVGGAVAMNAGTRDGEAFDRLVAVLLVDPDGELVVRGRAELAPRYRDGGLAGHVVLQATFELAADDPAAIQERLEASLRRRNATQPVSQKSLGCVFRNPPGAAAGQLIEAAGLKLRRRGGVEVSGRHANYFVSDGGSSRDFLELLEEVRAGVRERFGVELEPEVKVWRV
jgi:UDP-N-acetylmuramate dehydrogenase